MAVAERAYAESGARDDADADADARRPPRRAPAPWSRCSPLLAPLSSGSAAPELSPRPLLSALRSWTRELLLAMNSSSCKRNEGGSSPRLSKFANRRRVYFGFLTVFAAFVTTHPPFRIPPFSLVRESWKLTGAVLAPAGNIVERQYYLFEPRIVCGIPVEGVYPLLGNLNARECINCTVCLTVYTGCLEKCLKYTFLCFERPVIWHTCQFVSRRYQDRCYLFKHDYAIFFTSLHVINRSISLTINVLLI